MTDTKALAHVLREFGLHAEPAALPGGTTTTFRVGDVVLKRIKETSLENNHSPELAQWIAAFSAELPQTGFRVPRPRATLDGRWITPDGWTACSYLEGRHATAADVPECIAGIRAFHAALSAIPAHPLMDDNRTPWGQAHRGCWGEWPARVPPQLRPLVDQLYALRRSVGELRWQLIHGDLNPENILIAPGQAPALLDFSPFWAPVEFALAIYANWAGPRCGDASVPRHFQHIPAFDQLLVRAALRMLLVMAAIDRLEDWEACSEKRAAEIVIEHVRARGAGG